MHGLESEGGAPVQKINYVNAVYFPDFCLPVLSSGGWRPGVLHVNMASSNGGLCFCDEKEPHMGKWKKQTQKVEQKLFAHKRVTTMTLEVQRQAQRPVCVQQRWLRSQSHHGAELSPRPTDRLCHGEWL